MEGSAYGATAAEIATGRRRSWYDTHGGPSALLQQFVTKSSVERLRTMCVGPSDKCDLVHTSLIGTWSTLHSIHPRGIGGGSCQVTLQ
jgi:hypothetical protein